MLITQKTHILSALKRHLVRCRCGMNLVDGALEYPWVVLANSEIKKVKNKEFNSLECKKKVEKQGNEFFGMQKSRKTKEFNCSEGTYVQNMYTHNTYAHKNSNII